WPAPGLTRPCSFSARTTARCCSRSTDSPLARYTSAPRLIRAAGTEPFDTVAGGEAVIEHPDPGEVVWCDDDGVTCRRWHWRQGRRTQLREDTTTALFILDALDPMTSGALYATADDLVARLTRLGPGIPAAPPPHTP